MVCTIAGWLKHALKEAGFDIDKYKAHSFRSASTSRDLALGLLVNDILKRGNLRNESTWQKVYDKHVITSAEKYQNKVFSDSKYSFEQRTGEDWVSVI